MSGRSRVELIADGGAAAAADEFFRSPQLLRVEGVTHSVLVETPTTRLVLPIRCREIPQRDGFDAASPYGYPGGTLEGPPHHPTELDFGAAGLVSLFVRDRLDAPSLRGGVRRNVVLVHDPSRPRHLRDSFGYQVRRNERRGYATELVAGPDVDDDLLKAFAVGYEQTMRRANAAARYFFSLDYLRACLEFERSWLAVTRAGSGEVAAAAIAVVSDGFLHYFLGGSSEAHRSASPAKNGMVGLVGLADRLGLRLNFGGGLTPGDGLEQFKRGFANAETTFVTHEIICDVDAYARLSAGTEAGTFFPAYRAGNG